MASDRLWRNRNKKVILDSNALMMCFEFSIDIEDELIRLLGKCQIIVPKPIIAELDILSKKGKERKRRLAKPALILAKKFNIIELEPIDNGDDAIIYYAKKLSGIVVTNDRELIKRLKIMSINVIFLRGKKQLVLNG